MSKSRHFCSPTSLMQGTALHLKFILGFYVKNVLWIINVKAFYILELNLYVHLLFALLGHNCGLVQRFISAFSHSRSCRRPRLPGSRSWAPFSNLLLHSRENCAVLQK